jgi:ribose transport system substrate-binding protein
MSKVLMRVAMACLSVMVVLALGACGSSDGGGDGGSGGEVAGGSDRPVRIAHFMPNVGNTYNQANVRGAEDAAARMGDVKIQTFSADFDANKQVQQIQTATATGQYDAFVINPFDGVRVVPAIKAAAAKGIKVVCEFSVCGPEQTRFQKELDEIVAQTGIDTGRLGAEVVPVIADACGDKDPCNLVVLLGLAGLSTEKPYEAALKAGLKEHPNIKIVATGLGAYLADPSYKAMKDILQAHRDVDVVVAIGDQEIVGAEQAVNEAGLKGRVALIGDGASENAITAIKEGRWFGSSILRPYNDGFVAMGYAIRAARGEDVPGLTDTLKTDLIPGGVVTQDNVDRWTPEWAG